MFDMINSWPVYVGFTILVAFIFALIGHARASEQAEEMHLKARDEFQKERQHLLNLLKERLDNNNELIAMVKGAYNPETNKKAKNLVTQGVRKGAKRERERAAKRIAELEALLADAQQLSADEADARTALEDALTITLHRKIALPSVRNAFLRELEKEELIQFKAIKGE